MDQVPAAMDRQLDVLQCHRDGGLLLGASSLSGRYWLGSLWFYSNPALAPDVEKCTAGVQLEAGLQDAMWVDATNIIVGLDTGGVAVWALVDDFHTFVLSHCAMEHDNIVSSVSVTADGQKAVSAGYDGRVKVWDLNGLSCLNTYRAHTDIVWSVECHPTEKELFITCSQDDKTLLWDTRKPKPAAVIKCPRLQGCPTCTAWQPGFNNTVAVGSEVGSMAVTDIRMADEALKTYKPHTRRILRTEFSPNKPCLLASVSEDSRTVVVTVEEESINSIYSLCCHSDFVQGLTWFSSDCLYTCGWDARIVRHTLADSSKSNKTQSVIMAVNGEIPEKEDIIDTEEKTS